jgi:hypothetical protein
VIAIDERRLELAGVSGTVAVANLSMDDTVETSRFTLARELVGQGG